MNLWIRRILAVLEIGGGAVGLVVLTMSRPWTREASKGLWLLMALYVCVFLFAIAAGLLLAEGTRRGIRWSALCQALQIPVIVSSALTYRLFFAAHVTVGYFGTRWVVESGIGTTSLASIGQLMPVSPLMTAPGWGINLVALVAFLYLLWRLFRTRGEQESAARDGQRPESADQADPIPAGPVCGRPGDL